MQNPLDVKPEVNTETTIPLTPPPPVAPTIPMPILNREFENSQRKKEVIALILLGLSSVVWILLPFTLYYPFLIRTTYINNNTKPSTFSNILCIIAVAIPIFVMFGLYTFYAVIAPDIL